MINYLTFTNAGNYNNNYNVNPSFQGKTAKKLIDKLRQSQHVKKVHYTFDEAVKIYEDLGYDVLMKRGSHAIVRIGDWNMPLVIPHKDKYVDFFDIKRLKCIVDGDIEAAMRIQ